MTADLVPYPAKKDCAATVEAVSASRGAAHARTVRGDILTMEKEIVGLAGEIIGGNGSREAAKGAKEDER